MDEFQSEQPYNCPYCGELLTLLIDPSGGDSQTFTIDCEVCCHPIAIHLELQDGEVQEFSAERES